MEKIDKIQALDSDANQEKAAENNFDLPDLPTPVLTPPQIASPELLVYKEPSKPINPFAYSDIKDVIRMPIGFQCSVKFDAKDDYVAFLARADDVETHGRAIYAACAAKRAAKVPNYFPTDAELLEATQERVARELRIANAKVTIYQDRVDIDDASEMDAALLLAWKAYRVALNRVPQQPNYPHGITWPLSPAASAT